MKNILIYMAMLWFGLSSAMAQHKDWAQLNRYAQSNQEWIAKPNTGKRVVFLGNSITDNWASMRPDFFTSNGYIGRGISGQTSYQFLVRFREDVINLKPAVVVINAATNDVAENTGPYVEDYTFGNIVSMVELARINHIQVILTTTLPAASFSWNPEIKDAPKKIEHLNTRLKEYAATHNIPFVDYYSAMVSGKEKALNTSYTKDGVHPTHAGYEVMEKLIQKPLQKILKQL